MKTLIVLFTFVVAFLMQVAAYSQEFEILQPRPLGELITGTLQPVQPGPYEIPGILWGGETEHVIALKNGIFAAEGLNAKIVLDNDLVHQTQMLIDGQGAFVRGDVGMIIQVADAVAKYGIHIDVPHQFTWSVDGDMIVFRKGKNLSNCKKVALQIYGPHMRFAASVFADKGRLDQVKFVYFRNITPTNTGGLIDDGVTAFIKDSSIDAVFCVYNDAMNLTSGGKVGDGGVGTVAGAYIGGTSKSYPRIIGDVLGVRSDWAEQNPETVQKIAHAFMLAQEQVVDLYRNRETEKTRYNDLLRDTASFIELTPGDVDGLLSGCQFVGYDGNVKFLTGTSSVSLKGIVNEVVPIFRKMNLVSGGQISVTAANLDYQALAVGLKYVTNIPSLSAAATIDRAAVTQKLETRKAAAPTKTTADGTEPESDWSEEIFSLTINFDANVDDINSATIFAREFAKARDNFQKYSGCAIFFEGHADVRGINQAKEKGMPPAVVAQMEKGLDGLSLRRAQKICDDFIADSKAKGVLIPKEQCFATGYGIQRLVIKNPVDKADSKVNQRVIFRIVPLEAIN